MWLKTATLANGVTATLKFDAWNRVIGLSAAAPGNNSPVNGERTYAYDALGRQITETMDALNLVTQYYYDGGSDIEERDGGGNVLAQYVYSGDGSRELVLRDQIAATAFSVGAAPVGRLYAQEDAAGSITSLTDAAGAVRERYVYDHNGHPTFLDPTWTAWPSVPFVRETGSNFGWLDLYQGQRWEALTVTRGGFTVADTVADGVFRDGAQWYDPTHGRLLQPFTDSDPRNSPYDPTGGATGIGGWYGRNVNTIIGTTKAAAWLGGPVIGIATNWIADGYQRWLDGQDNEILGGLGDAVGITGIYNGFVNESWSEVGLGALQLFGSVCGFAQPLGLVGELSVQGGQTLNASLAAEAQLARQSFGITCGFFANGGSFGPPPAFAIAGGGSLAGSAGSAAALAEGAGGSGGWGSLFGGAGNAIFSLASAARGPRIDNRFGHNRMIRKVARDVTASGDEVINGGRNFDGVYRAEALIDTPGGFKNVRRPDLLVLRPDGSIYGINVGRVETSGLPVLRERLAIQDLNEQAGLEMQFVSYRGPK